MGVVAPISGVGAALVPVAVGLAAGERPGALVWLGHRRRPARASGWSPASPAPEDVGGDPPARPGSSTASWPGSGFGIPVRRPRADPRGGRLPARWRSTSWWRRGVDRGRWRPCSAPAGCPRQPAAAAGAVSGVLGAPATGAFLLATQQGLLTVTAVLASLYPAVTVLLAATVLREHVHRGQAVGLVLCGAAVALVAAG